MALPLSKTCDPADFAELQPELAVVDQSFTKAAEQHPMRRWEYAMALRVLTTWRDGRDYREPCHVADVGGAGSPFRFMLQAVIEPAQGVEVIDPNEPEGETLAEHVTPTLHGTALMEPCVFCLSVLEHVDDLDQFLYHLSCLVAPGGLLFLTMDCCDKGDTDHWPGDIYHFHWMRKRIFGTSQWASLIHRYRLFPTFDLLGKEDGWQYHGPQVYDYTFASLALTKRP